MTYGHMRTTGLLALVFASGALIPATSTVRAAPKEPAAGKKSAPACGVKVLPMVVGNSWVYQNVASPTPVREDISRFTPPPPKLVTITVKSIDTKGTDTVVTLEETATYEVNDPKVKDKKTVQEKTTSTITCNAKKFDISPDSFFFNGEPGGYRGLQFDKIERKKETSLKFSANGGIADQPWREEIVTHWTRVPFKGTEVKLGAGRLDMERQFTPGAPEQVNLKNGSYMAEKLAIQTTGRVILDGPMAPDGKPCLIRLPDGKDDKGEPKYKDVPDEKCEMPAGWNNYVWLAPDIGLVQSLNTYAHMYQLIEMKLN
jgi:hypothetical protein